MNIKKSAKFIDHSPLKMDATELEIIGFCKEAVEYSFHSIVVTIVGFPFGNELIEIKSQQAQQYLEMGVDEIDMVMNLSAFKSGKIDHVKKDIEAVLKRVRDKNALLKVIIEVELLSDQQ